MIKQAPLLLVTNRKPLALTATVAAENALFKVAGGVAADPVNAVLAFDPQLYAVVVVDGSLQTFSETSPDESFALAVAHRIKEISPKTPVVLLVHPESEIKPQFWSVKKDGRMMLELQKVLMEIQERLLTPSTGLSLDLQA